MQGLKLDEDQMQMQPQPQMDARPMDQDRRPVAGHSPQYKFPCTTS